MTEIDQTSRRNFVQNSGAKQLSNRRNIGIILDNKILKNKVTRNGTEN